MLEQLIKFWTFVTLLATCLAWLADSTLVTDKSRQFMFILYSSSLECEEGNATLQTGMQKVEKIETLKHFLEMHITTLWFFTHIVFPCFTV